MTASAPRWGMAPWQEVPWMSMRNQSVLAMRGPGSMEILPASTSLQMCMANAPSQSRAAPAATIILPPLPFSSEGWKTMRISPWMSSVMWRRICRVPSIMAMWQSWPQACMKPSFTEAYSTSVRSVTGSASMSARRSRRRRGVPSAR